MGILIPILVVVALGALPYILPNPKARNSASGSRVAIALHRCLLS